MLQTIKSRPRIRRSLRVLKVATLLVACVLLLPVIVALGGVAAECRPWQDGSAAQASSSAAQVERRPITADLTAYSRREDQTYLTLPEWYIVYSADEYAAFIRDNPPSHFPYFGAIRQFWSSYYNVCRVTREHYAFNGGYHLIMIVIGSSFTVENILKGLYENTFGRLTEWLSTPAWTPEDAYARDVAADYGKFLHTIPWYEFPFGAKLRGLWSESPLVGPNLIRKGERKVALSLEYGTKAVYSRLIKLGTRGAFAPADLEIQAWIEGSPAELVRQHPQVRVVKAIRPDAAIIALPRYEAFTVLVPQLARQGVRFVEIAGNDQILVTIVAPQSQRTDLAAGEVLFTMPILTQPDRERIAVKVPVAQLHELLNSLQPGNTTLEHIYDY